MSDDDVWNQVDRDFRENGFLGREQKHVRSHFRARFSDWFVLAEDLNRHAHEIYIAHSKLLHGKQIFDPVQLGLQMFPRALGFFQGAILLCPSGMGTEAQALIRIIFETNFWIGYLASDGPAAAEALRQAGLTEKIKLHREVFDRWNMLDDVTKGRFPESIQQLQDALGDERVSVPNMADLSTKSGFHQHYVFYRDLSGGAVHTGALSIQDYLWIDEEGFHRGHSIGPNEEATERALRLGCLALFGTLQAIRRLTEDASFEKRTDALWARSEELIGKLE